MKFAGHKDSKMYLSKSKKSRLSFHEKKVSFKYHVHVFEIYCHICYNS